MSAESRSAARVRRWPWLNYCQECGKRIPRSKRAFFGNRYRPVVCSEHSYSDPVALLRAAADLVKEHPEMAKYARGLS